MNSLKDHDQRYDLANELHARPFPEIGKAGQAIYFALTNPDGSEEARRALFNLLDRFGESHPAPGANHHYGKLGRHRVKWELHSEFVTYTLFSEDADTAPFSDDMMGLFPSDWLDSLAGEVLSAIQVRIEFVDNDLDVKERLQKEASKWFVGESLAAAFVLDGNAAIAGDFRIDESGQVRFAVFGIGSIGKRRMGRVVQRLLEIETYKSMAMLTLPVARRVFSDVGRLDEELSDIARDMSDKDANPEQTLDRLLEVSAKVEVLSATSTFRFSAGRAYHAIVDQRIEVLRESRILDRQLFSEFMMRRFKPAMRTCDAAEKRLVDLSERAAKAADLLGTRVSVARADQNRKLLESMNKRAALQMRLQETVEGLSVVAISYYAINLLLYLLQPLSKPFIDKTLLAALLVVPVLVIVALMIRRVKSRVAEAFGKENSNG